ncbi:N-acetyltransferase [Mesorhizobium sp. M0062]|uniref:GNAT family N-acetyltransferase n=1 Tax=unclassified Mesorhizobium TaxID=325217 RepID=UPI0003D021B9|nr:N-acetyltransferase [Mesorhizobium sp. L103C131B0]ESZ61562.1 GCN5 family N-acetyltransferase [Mesorhizobium sp. L103C131B0]
MFIRPERPDDKQTIHDLTIAAFEPTPFSDGSEAPIITKLRNDGDLTVSLVAVRGGDIVGHVAFSPVTVGVESDGWYGLGPVSVWPDKQRQGIGSALINEGLAILKTNGAKGCVLIGDPAYYGRFGFRSDGNLSYQELPAQYVQSLPFQSEPATGQLKFSPAFDR